MTQRTNARVAGFTFLFYIAVGIASVVVGPGEGETVALRLADIADHAGAARLTLLLAPLIWMSALVLAVTLFALVRNEDADLARLVLVFRLGEGVVGATATLIPMSLLWLAVGGAADQAGTDRLAGLLFEAERWSTTISALLFALGSTVFSWLLLRGRLVPSVLAGLGVLASVILLVGLPLQLAGYLHGSLTQLMWIPMAAFEIPLGFWLIFKGTREAVR